MTILFGYILCCVCFNLYRGCFNLFCNVWVCVCVGFVTCVYVLVICVILFTVFCIVPFIYLCTYLFVLVKGLLPPSDNSIAVSSSSSNLNGLPITLCLTDQ